MSASGRNVRYGPGVAATLTLARDRILAHRRRAGMLDARAARSREALRRAAFVGLTDSMPRAALLSIHARVTGTEPETWADPAFVQVWGPRFSAYVVAAGDHAPFTLGRLPDGGAGRKRAEDMADRLAAFLGDRRMAYGAAGRGVGVDPNALRYATATGRVLIRWDGARQPTIWMVPRPEVEPRAARLELARRYLHVCGPATPTSFGNWAGIKPVGATAAFDDLAAELSAVRTPIGDAWILSADEASFRKPVGTPADVRLLPSGDAYTLLQGLDRELLVPDARQRSELWTSRVWPGAVLVAGEIVGTWRRAEAVLSVRTWGVLPVEARDAIEAEAAGLPLPGLSRAIAVRWDH